MNTVGLWLAIPALVLVAVDIVAVIMVVVGVRGSARVLAAIGLGTQIVTLIASTGFSMMLPQLVNDFHLDLTAMRLISLLFSLITALILAAGLVLVGLSIGSRGRRHAAGVQP